MHNFEKWLYCFGLQIKPVRESLSEALNVWKNIAGKGESGISDDQKDVSSEQCTLERNGETDSIACEGAGPIMQGSSDDLSSNSDSISKAVLILRKKAPRLTGKDLNPEFFQKLENRGSGDMPVEVVLPCRQKNSSNSNTEDESDANTSGSRSRSKGLCRTAGVHPKQRHFGDFAREKWVDERTNGGESRLRAFDGDQTEAIQAEASENRGNWPPLQRQLLHLERQQTHIMNMLQVLFRFQINIVICFEAVSFLKGNFLIIVGFHGWFTRRHDKFGEPC